MHAEQYTANINACVNDLFFFLFLCNALCRYTVMSGAPEKILEHLLETVKLDSNGNDAMGESLQAYSCLFPFLLSNDCRWPSQLVNELYVVVMFVSLQLPVWVTFCSPTKSSCPPVNCVLLYSTNILNSNEALVKIQSGRLYFACTGLQLYFSLYPAIHISHTCSIIISLAVIIRSCQLSCRLLTSTVQIYPIAQQQTSNC